MTAIGKKLLFVVSGPSGVGKSTLCRKMVSMVPGIRLSVSCTTRKPRKGEMDGREYQFISKEKFQEKIQKGEFVEWAEVYGQYYGTPWSELDQESGSRPDLLLDIDVQGARQVMNARKQAVTVFVLPPSLETLQKRLAKRGTDTVEEQERRFQKAQEEMRHYTEYQYTIRNETIEQAVQELQAVIMAERVKTHHVDSSQVFH